MLYIANERTDIQSTIRHVCTRLASANQGVVSWLKKLLRYLQATRSTVTSLVDEDEGEKVLNVYADSDWATDVRDRKRTSGGLIMAGSCRLYAHSRAQDVVALSSCEAQLYSANEVMKDAILISDMLLFIGMGSYMLQLYLDASAARCLLNRRGPGCLKHIDVRSLWLQWLI